MYLTIKGLVLRVTNYNDTDALLTVLTHDHGRLTVKVRNLRRRNSRLSAPCQLLAYSEFTLFNYKDMYTVNEASAIELFQGLRKDIQKLSLGSYFAQLSEVLSQEDMPSPELLSLTLNSLYALSSMNLDEIQVKATFELRCACLAGFMPDLSGCSCCGATCSDRFNVSAGHLECSKCSQFGSEGLRVPVSPGVLDAMRYICNCKAKQIFAYKLGDEAMTLLSQVTELYLVTQLERGFSTLDFYKSLLFMS